MDVQGIVDGALFAVQSPLALGAVLAASLANAPGSPRLAVADAIALAAGSLLALLLPDSVPPTPTAASVLLLLGLFLAANQRLRGARTALVLVPGGVAAGLASGLATATPAEAVGTVATLLVAALAVLLLRAVVRIPVRAQHGASIARRMAGAWIAAVGVLMIALWLRGVA